MASQRSGQIRIIVAPTDFSANSAAGLAWAIRIAREHGARIHLVHAVVFIEDAVERVDAAVEFRDEVLASARQQIEEEAAALATEGVEVTTEVDLGQPSRTILRIAAELAADLIVLGTRGLSGVRHLLLGSTAERVVQHAACPVLAIHPEDGLRHRRVGRILIPTDLSEDASLALEGVARCFPEATEEAEVVLLHSFPLPVEYSVYGPQGLSPVGRRYREEMQQRYIALLEEMAEPLREARGLEVKTVVGEGRPSEVIVSEALLRRSDLVAVATRGRSAVGHLLLGSTAERVVQHAPCPVLTVRRPEG